MERGAAALQVGRIAARAQSAQIAVEHIVAEPSGDAVRVELADYSVGNVAVPFAPASTAVARGAEVDAFASAEHNSEMHGVAQIPAAGLDVAGWVDEAAAVFVRAVEVGGLPTAAPSCPESKAQPMESDSIV